MMEWNGTEPRELSLWPSKAEQRKKGAPTDTAARRTRDRHRSCDATSPALQCNSPNARDRRYRSCDAASPALLCSSPDARDMRHRCCDATLPTHAA